MEKNFTKFKNCSNPSELLKYFKINSFDKGHILTTAISGSQDLFLITKGKVLIFVNNKYNPDYPFKFIVFSILEKGNTFNENATLFDKDTINGAMVLEDDTEILSLEKNNLVFVSSEDSINSIKANAECKNRFLKNFIEKIQGLKGEELETQQKTLSQKLGLEFETLMHLFKKNMKGDKILTTEGLVNEKKNLEKFNAIFPKQIDVQVIIFN